MKFIIVFRIFCYHLAIFLTKGFIIKEFNSILTPEIKLIIECCKLSQNSDFIESNITLIKDWDDFLSLAYSHGIFPLVYKTLKNYTQIPTEIQNTMKRINMNIVKQNMLMTSELLKVTKLLEENGIEAISFKGPVLSLMAYGDVISRQYCDLDILVNEKLLEKAKIVLEQNKYSSKFDLEDYQKENLKNTVHDISMINKINGVNIELHWTLSSGEFFIDLEKLKYLEDTEKYTVLNQELDVFSNDKLFIYLCVHGYKHLWERIEWLTDIYYLIQKQDIDIKKVIDIAKSVDADRIVLSTLIIYQKIFGLQINLKDISLINDKKLNNITDLMLEKIIKDYRVVNEKVHSKEFSIIHLYMLKTNTNKIKYLKTFLKPTEIDYESIKLPKYLAGLYFLVRPLNIIKRVFSNQKNHN